MKFALQVVVTLLLCWLLQSFLPWWTLAIGAFIVGYLFSENGFKSFLAGLLGVGLLWAALSYYIDYSTGSGLAAKVALLFPTKTVPLLIVITALVGGLVGGFASMTGALITYRKKRKW